MSHDVFISYSSQDKPIADAICAAIEAKGIRCWVAPRDVLPGTDYAEAIVRGISDGRAMVLIFSANANESPHVRREVERAVSKAKIILPFRVEDVLPSASLEYCLSNTHWLDALTPPIESRIAELVATIARLLGTDAEIHGPVPSPVEHRTTELILDRNELLAVAQVKSKECLSEKLLSLEPLKLSMELVGTIRHSLDPSSMHDTVYAARLLQQIEALPRAKDTFYPVRRALKEFLDKKSRVSFYDAVMEYRMDQELDRDEVVNRIASLGIDALPSLVSWFLALPDLGRGYYIPTNIQCNMLDVFSAIGGSLATSCVAVYVGMLPNFDSTAMTSGLNALRKLLGTRKRLEEVYESVTGRKLRSDEAEARTNRQDRRRDEL